MDDLSLRQEVVLREPDATEAELIEGGKDAPGVFRGAPDEEVEVLREARFAVEGEGVGADDEVLNAPSVEGR